MQNICYSHIFLVGGENSPNTLENSLEVSYKAEHILTIEPSDLIPKDLPKRIGKIDPHRIQMFIGLLS